MKDELIEKYFNGRCTRQEAEAVVAFLRENPEHPYLLKDWDDADALTPLPGNYTQEMYDMVEAHIKTPEKAPVHRLWIKLAAACAVIALISFWMVNTKYSGQPEAVASSELRPVEWIETKNAGDTAMVAVLPDGSRVTIFPDAVIRYRKNFANYNRRDIYMSGEAFFEVAKDKTKPFTVYSGYVRTTALGTAFRVLLPAAGDGIKVRLTEGKVVVAVTDTALNSVHGDYYLLPGQELVFSARNKPALVHTFIKHKPAALAVLKTKMGQQQTDESYIFNNQTLADVLDQLAAIYHVKISYSEKDIGTIYFIGKIETNDPVEKIIADIALLNKLSVKRQAGGFSLTRTKR